MLYIWLSDFTLNSAGRIYHETGRLKYAVAPSDKSVSLFKFYVQFLQAQSNEQILQQSKWNLL